jgi:hypothetical protein
MRIPSSKKSTNGGGNGRIVCFAAAAEEPLLRSSSAATQRGGGILLNPHPPTSTEDDDRNSVIEKQLFDFHQRRRGEDDEEEETTSVLPFCSPESGCAPLAILDCARYIGYLSLAPMVFNLGILFLAADGGGDHPLNVLLELGVFAAELLSTLALFFGLAHRSANYLRPFLALGVCLLDFRPLF